MRDLRQDIWRDDEILNKIRSRKDYAQNLYAAFCNMQWCPRELWPIIKEEYWTASWRSAGGIVAEFEGQQGDYMDWYCSGMGGLATYEETEGEAYMAEKKYVPEGVVTEEIESDLNRLGWIPIPYKD